MSTAIAKPGTADELLRLPPGWRYEIDEGALVIMSPAGRRHGRIVAEVARRLGNFVHDHPFGEVVGGAFGVYLQREPETLRGGPMDATTSRRPVRSPLRRPRRPTPRGILDSWSTWTTRPRRRRYPRWRRRWRTR